MTLRFGLITTLGIAALACPIAVQAQSPQQVTVTGRDDEAEEQAVVCKYQANTGTRFRSKTCKTKQQWEQMRLQHQRDAKEFMDKPTINTNRD